MERLINLISEAVDGGRFEIVYVKATYFLELLDMFDCVSCSV
jgi:hypothetical protein